MNDPIIIAISFDKGYAEQATLLLYSLLSNNLTHTFRIYIFFNDLDEATQKRISSNLAHFPNFEIVWKKFDATFTDGLYIRQGHANKYTYTRLLMSDVLSEVDKFLYLDCDMLVLHDISELWETDMQDKALAAAIDPYPFDRYQYLNIPVGKKYFNAGVLLFNAKKWREKKYAQLVIDTLVKLGIHATCWDQDGLNSALYDDWVLIDQKWNIQSHNVEEAQRKQIKNIRKHLSPKIIHFTGNLKPWNFKSSNPFKKEYYQYLKQTDFARTHRPENKTTVNVLRRAVRNTLLFMGVIKY